MQSIKIWKEINILKKLLKEKSFLEEYLFPINRIQEKINYFKELLILVEQEKKKDESSHFQLEWARKDNCSMIF